MYKSINYSGLCLIGHSKGVSSVVEQLTHFLKVEASNPATAVTKIEKIARKMFYNTSPVCQFHKSFFGVIYAPSGKT